ncbi:hypothetical protein EG327_008666 [Venturia inaequalis]|uniref:Origin recognition complex subunit 4 n=1 Tax=Venturia inaequalis TaxID=5025 RepID=A0A8H3ZB62_VENIN|nr:hypothetical protein EG327_008666 [Venturia inaequalis]
MARKEAGTPMTVKRRKLNDTTAPSSAPAKRKSTREKELDLYDDIDGGLTRSEPKKKKGWKGWVEIDEDEVTSDEEEVIVTTTPAKRQAKLKANDSLSSIVKKATHTGKSKGTLKDKAAFENDEDEDEDEIRAIVSKETERSTAKKRARRKVISSEESDEESPEAESPTKRPAGRRRSAGPRKIAREDEDVEDAGTPAKSTSRKRQIPAETPSKSRKRQRRVIEEDEDGEESEELAIVRTPSKNQKQRRPLRQLYDRHEEPEAMEIDPVQDEIELEVPVSRKISATNGTHVGKTMVSAEITLIKSVVLSKLTQRRPVPLTNLDTEYAKVHQLLEATINSGESNSMLIIGARGSGKTTLVNKALLELSRSQKQHFHIVRLNGFIQTDDKLALREIWRQLGREMEIEDEEGTTNKSYADTLAMLLALLSHPDEISGERGDQTAKSVIFIMDEFDLFATHPRQTLLYNLLDIAQSRKAPIAVLGLTTRIDVTEALEKRVKSRFSHRYVHLNLARTLSEYVDAAKSALKILSAELAFEEKTVLVNSEVHGTKKKGQRGDVLELWNRAIDSIFANTTFQRTILHPPYHTKARINANAAGQLATGSGMRVYGKEVARREWEGLVRLGLCVRVGGGAFGAGTAAGNGGGRDMVRVDVALEEIPGSVGGLGGVMEKWCRQI